MSPINASCVSGVAPALIIAAECDTLRDEAKAYSARLGSAGIATRYICAEGMVHGFLQMGGIVPQATKLAFHEIAETMK